VTMIWGMRWLLCNFETASARVERDVIFIPERALVVQCSDFVFDRYVRTNLLGLKLIRKYQIGVS